MLGFQKNKNSNKKNLSNTKKQAFECNEEYQLTWCSYLNCEFD